ncbi:MAG TPA: alpha/beta fold hydrolase, partial [Mycobacteriales bacterium]|nr:alpha/beta fold hydrolase [Mycobacteriales bacterium]
MRTLAAAVLVAVTAVLVPTPAYAEGTVGTTFPADFSVPTDASLGVPVIGFGGADGEVRRTPVIFLHGNNDTPYPTTCNGAYGAPLAFAQHFADAGYTLRELWGLGYQGDQCDLLTDQTRRAAEAHTTVANVPDLRAFVRAVLDYTGAEQVDLVGHSLGASLSREWMRQDDAYPVVRRLVSIDGPHHGIINCSPSPQNYYAPTLGFTPDSPVCVEYGAADSEFLTRLNAGDETPGPTEYLAIVNTDASFVYLDRQDGVLPPVPAQDSAGRPHDFSDSARLAGAETVELTGQGRYDGTLLAAHTGIVNSPDVWARTLDFLSAPPAVVDPAPRPAPAPTPRPAPLPPAVPLPATGG